MQMRVFALLFILGILPLPVDGQSTIKRPIVPKADTHRSKERMLFMGLQRALARDNVEQAAEQIEELLLMGATPVTVFHRVRAAATPRGAELLPTALEDYGSAKTTLERRELLLLLAVHTGNEASTDSLIRVWRNGPVVSHETLTTVAATARATGNMPAALWAYNELRVHHEPVHQRIVVPLAECLVHEGKPDEAVILLDSLLASEGVPRTYRDEARLLQARLVYQFGEQTAKALDLLRAVTDRRARTEAELLAALIQFLDSGNDSVAHRLERVARMRPDIKEANDAFDLARLSQILPPDNDEREGVLRALRMDIRQQWEPAGRAYLDLLPALDEPLFSSLSIRAARCLEEAGEFEKALEAWEEATKTDVQNAVALLGKGDCQAAMGLADSAKATYMHVLRLYPESPHAARARSRLLD